jgi:hypothetical protein
MEKFELVPTIITDPIFILVISLMSHKMTYIPAIYNRAFYITC